MHVNNYSKENNKPMLILMLTIVFSFYYIEIGFALKPIMIFSLIYFVIILKKFYFERLRVFETFMLIFFGYYCITGLFAEYKSYSLRMILGILLVIFCYFIMKYIMSIASIKSIEKTISFGGIIFNGLSLILYFAGLVALNFVLIGNQIREYGVMMDRGFPRLIGLMNDPNIFCFYNFIFFFYYLTHLDKRWSKLGLALSTLTFLLTMSRGGILSIAFGIFLMVFSMNLIKKIKMLFILPIIFFSLNLIAKWIFKIDVITILVDRFTSGDGGSGRSDIWAKGLELFAEKPIFGIGIFNYRPLSESVFGSSIYMHNSYMEALVEGGLIGITLYLLIFVLIFVTYYINRRKIMDKGYVIFSFVALSFMMATYSFMVNEVFFFIVALIGRYLTEINKEETIESNLCVEMNKPKKKKKKYKIVW